MRWTGSIFCCRVAHVDDSEDKDSSREPNMMPDSIFVPWLGVLLSLKVTMKHPSSEITRSSTALESQELIDKVLALYMREGNRNEESGPSPASSKHMPPPGAPAPVTTGVPVVTCLEGALKNELNHVVGGSACCVETFLRRARFTLVCIWLSFFLGWLVIIKPMPWVIHTLPSRLSRLSCSGALVRLCSPVLLSRLVVLSACHPLNRCFIGAQCVTPGGNVVQRLFVPAGCRRIGVVGEGSASR